MNTEDYLDYLAMKWVEKHIKTDGDKVVITRPFSEYLSEFCDSKEIAELVVQRTAEAILDKAFPEREKETPISHRLNW